MTEDINARGVIGAALGLTTLLLVAADTVARIAPDRMPVAGHARLGEAITAIAVPALFLIFGRLCAGEPLSIIGLRRTALVRGLLAVFVFATAARMIDASTYGVDPMLALGASLYWPDGAFTVLPGLALLILAAPRISAARPFFVVGLAAGLFLSRVSTGVVLIDAAAANAIFFVVGLAGCRLIDGFVGAVRHERGEVLLCATVLVAIVLLAAAVGVARAPIMSLILGAAGIAVVLSFAAELARTRLGAGLDWLGAHVLVLLIGMEVPLALLGRGPAGSTAAALAGLGFVIVASTGLAALSAWSARRGAAHRLYRRAASAETAHTETA
jgi:hypothetical protein